MNKRMEFNDTSRADRQADVQHEKPLKIQAIDAIRTMKRMIVNIDPTKSAEVQIRDIAAKVDSIVRSTGFSSSEMEGQEAHVQEIILNVRSMIVEELWEAVLDEREGYVDKSAAVMMLGKTKDTILSSLEGYLVHLESLDS